MSGGADEARAVQESPHEVKLRKLELANHRAARFSDRLNAVTQMLIIAAVVVVSLGLGLMLRDAFASKAVIVDPFDTPPDLAKQGLSEKVLAGHLLDDLTRLQLATRSAAAKRNLSNAWTGDIKVEVPHTGVSIGDIDRLLKARFGHDTHIGGDLVQTPGGNLALTVRGDGVAPKTFTGPAATLDELTEAAAEYVYSQSQPFLYAQYLYNQGRYAQSLAFAKGAVGSGSVADRPYLLNVWANGLAAVNAPGYRPEQSLALYRQALILKPDYWIAHNNVMNSTWGVGDEEGAWRAGEQMRRVAGGRPGKAGELYYQNWDVLTWNLLPWRAALRADTATNGVGTSNTANGPALADVSQRLHDDADADLQLETAQGDASDKSVAAISHFVRGRMAAEAGDTVGAAAEMEAFVESYSDPVVASNYPGYGCWVAPAEEYAGHPDKADAALKAGGHYVDCYRFRADILDHRGDWAGAQKAYADAVAIAPDLPAAYYSWGLALGRHGDLAGEQAKLAEANRRGPHWADPLKAWGDTLARQGQWRAALVKYREALKYAPAWGQLRVALEAAKRRAG
jgi:tetratricopeptide (TPR) repeat protein